MLRRSKLYTYLYIFTWCKRFCATRHLGHDSHTCWAVKKSHKYRTHIYWNIYHRVAQQFGYSDQTLDIFVLGDTNDARGHIAMVNEFISRNTCIQMFIFGTVVFMIFVVYSPCNTFTRIIHGWLFRWYKKISKHWRISNNLHFLITYFTTKYYT